MKMKVLMFIWVIALIPFVSYAQDKNVLYSKISTSFTISKIVDCNELKAQFAVYAEGDNYSMAIKRVSKINNGFAVFLKKLFPKQDIQTVNSYGYSKTATIYISIHTKKINKISKVLSYIAKKNFPYKSGIKPVYIRFGLSDKLKAQIKDELFKDALIQAKNRLSVINKTLSSNYEISNISVDTQYPVYYAQNRAMVFGVKNRRSIKTDSAAVQTLPGSISIKSSVRLEFAKRLK